MSSAMADHWVAPGRPPRPLYVVAEKILVEGESLPADWAVDGTTGYDFLNAVNGLFIHQGGREAFDRAYHGFVGLGRLRAKRLKLTPPRR